LIDLRKAGYTARELANFYQARDLLRAGFSQREVDDAFTKR